MHYARDAWLTRIEETSAEHERALQGDFFEEAARSVTDCAPEVQIGSVVEERRTQGGATELVDTLRCALVVGLVGDAPSILHVRVCRSIRPPPR